MELKSLFWGKADVADFLSVEEAIEEGLRDCAVFKQLPRETEVLEAARRGVANLSNSERG